VILTFTNPLAGQPGQQPTLILERGDRKSCRAQECTRSRIPHPWPAVQRGVALISSLLLLIIITILRFSMFRSFGTQEKIAGNLREKRRALQCRGGAHSSTASGG